MLTALLCALAAASGAGLTATPRPLRLRTSAVMASSKDIFEGGGGEERCDAEEWADFESFICEQRGVSELAELEDEELEQVLAPPAQRHRD